MSSNGIGAAKMAAITRAMRHSGRLVVKGHGVNARHLTATEVAELLIATAGAGKAVKAVDRLNELEKLRSASDRTNLIDALTQVLMGEARARHLVEVRIGRNVRAATLVYPERVEEFRSKANPDYRYRVRVDGVLPYALLHHVAELIKTEASVPDGSKSEEPDDDA